MHSCSESVLAGILAHDRGYDLGQTTLQKLTSSFEKISITQLIGEGKPTKKVLLEFFVLKLLTIILLSCVNILLSQELQTPVFDKYLFLKLSHFIQIQIHLALFL